MAFAGLGMYSVHKERKTLIKGHMVMDCTIIVLFLVLCGFFVNFAGQMDVVTQDFLQQAGGG